MIIIDVVKMKVQVHQSFIDGCRNPYQSPGKLQAKNSRRCTTYKKQLTSKQVDWWNKHACKNFLFLV